MTRTTASRPPVLSHTLAAQLLGYIAFRHYVCHAYVFTLDWALLEHSFMRSCKFIVPCELSCRSSSGFCHLCRILRDRCSTAPR